MTRTLLIIFGAATILCIASFAGAAALGGADLQRNGWTWIIDDEDGHSRIRRSTSVEIVEGPETTRTVAWTGGQTLTLQLPADVTFIQGDTANVVITGPQTAVERVQVDGGRIGMRDGSDRAVVRWDRNGIEGWSDTDRLRIVVTAPDVTRFDVEGSSDLTIQDYDQDVFTLDVSGSGDVSATGRTTTVDLDIAGSGDVDLSDLTTTDARADISGSGDATLAPTGEAAIAISGSGDVDLTTRPARLTQDITGSGDIDERG